MGIPVDDFLKHLTGTGVTMVDVMDQLRDDRPLGDHPAPTASDLLPLLDAPGHGLGPDVALFAAPGDPCAGMNKTERRYVAEVLERGVLAGDVAWWRFEAFKLRLAPRCFLTLDFAVVDSECRLTLVDVKGRKDGSWYATEDFRIKARVAAHLFPLPISVAWPLGKGKWGKERIGG